MKRILLAAALIAALHMPAQAEQWWSLYGSNPSSGVLDSCKIDESPAEDFALLSSQGYFPHFEDSGDEVDVVYKQPNGHVLEFSFFRTRAACLAQAQIEVGNANKYQ